MISDLLDRFRPDRPTPAGRRQFFRRAAGTGLAALAGSTLLADPSWAAVEARAEAMGITPGTLVDAQGRPVKRPRGASTPEGFIGQTILVGYNFATRSWALCNGQLLPISQNTALFSLLGTIYGGDGRTTFALPDLRGRVPMHFGTGPGLSTRQIGQRGGAETVTLNTTQLPNHTHAVVPGASSEPGTTDDPAGAYPARPASSIPQYGLAADVNLGATATTATGGNLPHDNMPPFLVMNYQIALQGIFPSRN